MLETMYKTLFESAPVPLIVTDKKGTIKLANGQASALLDNNSTPLVGLSFCDLIDQSFLKSHLRDKSSFSFEDLLEAYHSQHDHGINSAEQISVYAGIKAVAFGPENDKLYIWTLDPIAITEKLKHDLNERVKEQLCILNVIELCFQNQNIHTTLKRCLQPIRQGWQFPDETEIRITLTDGEEYSTEKFKKTEWCLQSEIVTTTDHYGDLEVCYLHKIPAYGGKIFLYEEERLIKGSRQNNRNNYRALAQQQTVKRSSSERAGRGAISTGYGVAR